jgi:hypothetical protein
MPAPFDFSQTVPAHTLVFRREVSDTTLDWAHCSSIIVRRLAFCRMAFLPGLLTYFFLEKVP